MWPPKCRQCSEGAGCGRVSTDSLLLPQLFFSYTPQTAQLTTLILNLRMCSVHKCKEQLFSLKLENVKGIISRSTMSLPSAFHRLFFKIAWEYCLKEWKQINRVLPSAFHRLFFKIAWENCLKEWKQINSVLPSAFHRLVFKIAWENCLREWKQINHVLPSAFHRLVFKIAWENCLKEWKPFRLLSWLASLPPTSILQYPCFYQLAAAAAKSLQSCPTLCDPIDGSPPGPLGPGILQARTLEWVAISFSNAWKWKVKVKSLSRVRLLATPWTAAHQPPPSMRFSRQKYWSEVPLLICLQISWMENREKTLNLWTMSSSQMVQW